MLLRSLFLSGALALGATLSSVACSSSSTPAPGGGGTGGSNAAGGTSGGAGAAGKAGQAAGAGASGAAGTSAKAGSSGSTSAAGAPSCGNLTLPSTSAACASCMATSCCDEQIACTATTTCSACDVIEYGSPAGVGAAGASGAAGSGGTGTAGSAGAAGAAGAGAGAAGTAGAAGAGAAASGGEAGSSSSGPDCGADPEYSALQTCLLSNCAVACGIQLAVLDCSAPKVAPSQGSCFDTTNAAIPCNPLKHTGCTADTAPTMSDPDPPAMPSVPTDLNDGYACDGNVNAMNEPTFGLVCYAPPNTQVLCQPCGDDINKFCADGFRCITTLTGGQCAAYCCDDGDCSANAKCDTSLISDISTGMFGVCVSM